MARFGLFHSLLGTHALPTHNAYFTSSSFLDSSLAQTCSYSDSGNIIAFSNRLLSGTRSIQGNYFIGGQIDSQGLVFQQTVTRLTDMYKRVYKGLVYNLAVEEDESYCIGIDKIAVHNCTCLLIREPENSPLVYDMWSRLGTDWKELPKKEQ